MHNFEFAQDKERTIELENGNKLRLTRTDPYGFIYLSLERGQLPDNLKGHAFTEWSFAETAAKKYITERSTVLKEPIKKAV